MGVNNLENKIRENKIFFEESIPFKHLERFQAKLSQLDKPKKRKSSFLLNSNRSFAIAASVSILLLISIFALLEFPKTKAQPQLSEDMMHVKMYYTQLTDEKMVKIRNCTSESTKNDMLFETTEDRLQKLDNNTRQLEQKLVGANGNKQLESAYIQNLQAKSEVVNQIYAQICEDNTNSIITQ